MTSETERAPVPPEDDSVSGKRRLLPLPRTVPGNLLVLLLVLLLPLLALQAAIYYRNYQEMRVQRLEANLDVARAASVAFGAYVQDILHEELALGMAITPASLRPSDINGYLKVNADQYPSLREFFWSDPRGTITASSSPALTGVEITDRDYFQAVASGKDWAVSDMLQAKVGGDAVFVIARGVRDGNGKLLGIMAATVLPDKLSAALPIERTGGAAITVIDRQGRIVFRTPPVQLSWEQRSTTQTQQLVSMTLAGVEATGDFTSEIDGQSRIGGFTPVPSIGWVARAGQSVEEVTLPLLWDVLTDAALFLVISAIAFAAAWLLSRRITRPLERLERQAAVIAGGTPGVQTEVSGPAEVAHLAAALNRMSVDIGLRQEQLTQANARLQEQAEQLVAQNEELHAQAEELQVQAEVLHAQQEVQARLVAIVESSEDAIISKDLEGFVTSWNPAAERLYGYRAAEMVGRHLSIVFPSDRAEELKSNLDLIRWGRKVEPYDTVRLSSDGSPIDVSVTVSPIRNALGEVIGASTIAHDIGERKRAEEERLHLMEEAQHRAAELDAANRELEAFSYSVSHDLRAPLRTIDGFSKALLEDYAEVLDEDGQEYLNWVRKGTQKMGRLIDDMLALSRVTRSEMRREPVDLSILARDVEAELRRTQPERRVTFDVAGGVEAEGDVHLLRQVMANLLGNAWKFTSKREEARIEFGTTLRDGERVYFVRDNGVGFDPTYASKLFGAFQRLHGEEEFPGTGVGLATVQRIVRRHGGRIWADAAVGQGATFYYTLHGASNG